MDHHSEINSAQPCRSPCQTPYLAAQIRGCAAARTTLVALSGPARSGANPMGAPLRRSVQPDVTLDESVDRAGTNGLGTAP